MDIVRKKLTPDDLYPPYLRYDVETDAVQITGDGGATWQDAPELDPRITNAFPPLTGSAARCDAAARMSAALEGVIMALINAISGGAQFAALQGILMGWLAVFGFFFVLVALAALVLALFVAIGYAALYSAFNAFDWDGLTCRIYCLVDTEGRLNAETLQQLKDAIASDYDETQSAILSGLLDLTGFGALNAFAATRTETGDCEECGCAWSYTWDFANDGQGVWDVWNGRSTWVAGVGFESVNNAGGWPTIAAIAPTLTLDAGTEITNAWVSTDIVDASGATCYFFYDLTGGLYYSSPNADCPIEFESNLGGSGAKDWMWEIVYGVETGFAITGMTFIGTGTNPFGSDSFDPDGLCA